MNSQLRGHFVQVVQDCPNFLFAQLVAAHGHQTNYDFAPVGYINDLAFFLNLAQHFA